MTTAADNSWMPSGRHQVNLGPSLTRALKARKSGPIKNTKVKADREFYSFRYNFKPESVDVTGSGTVETRRPKDEAGPSTVTVVRPSQQNGSGISFVGQEASAKEFECVLVYDENTGTITLEKIDSYVILHHDPKPTLAPRHVGSPAPAAPPRMSASSSSSNSHIHQPPVKQEEEESEGEIPETKPEPKPDPKPKQPSRPTPVPKVKPRQQPAPGPASVPTTAPPAPTPAASAGSRSQHGLPSKPIPVVPPKLKGKAPAASPQTQSPSIPRSPNKRERPVEPEEETLEIRRPQPVLKKPKLVKKDDPPPPPPPPKPVALSLPNSSSAVSLPPPLAPVPASTVPDPIAPAAPSDSDDDEWDDVAAFPPPALAASSGPSPHIIMEEIDEFTLPPAPRQPELAMDVDEPDAEGEEIDMADMLERELNEGLLNDPFDGSMPDEENDNDDFLAGAMSPVAERQPISLSAYAEAYAGGGADYGDDEEYSSSDDSDDD